MSVFKVNAAGGLVREAGSFVRTEGLDEIRQGNQTDLLLCRGDVPTNLSLGLPWFGDARTDAPALLGKETPPEVLGSRVRAQIARGRGVVEVTELTVSPSTLAPDAVSISYSARVSTDQLQRALLSDQITVG